MSLCSNAHSDSPGLGECPRVYISDGLPWVLSTKFVRHLKGFLRTNPACTFSSCNDDYTFSHCKPSPGPFSFAGALYVAGGSQLFKGRVVYTLRFPPSLLKWRVLVNGADFVVCLEAPERADEGHGHWTNTKAVVSLWEMFFQLASYEVLFLFSSILVCFVKMKKKSMPNIRRADGFISSEGRSEGTILLGGGGSSTPLTPSDTDRPKGK